MNNISRQMLLNFSRENEEFIYNFGKFSDFKERVREKADNPDERKTGRQVLKNLTNSAKDAAIDTSANALATTRDLVKKVKDSPKNSKKKIFFELMKSVKLVDFLDACELSLKHYDGTSNKKISDKLISDDIEDSVELIKHFADLIFSSNDSKLNKKLDKKVEKIVVRRLIDLEKRFKEDPSNEYEINKEFNEIYEQIGKIKDYDMSDKLKDLHQDFWKKYRKQPRMGRGQV